MSDYRGIIRKPETLNWFKAAMGMNITRDCLLDIVKEATQELYHTIRKEINRKHGILENVVCSQCHTQTCCLVIPIINAAIINMEDAHFMTFISLEIAALIYAMQFVRKLYTITVFAIVLNQKVLKALPGKTQMRVNGAAIPGRFLNAISQKDGYTDVNKVEKADFNGIVNLLYNCEFFQMYFNDDLTQKENVCIKARGVRRAVCHSPPMSMTSLESDRAIDTLVALLQSLKLVDHQAAANTAVDRLTQLKNGTLAITTEDVATTFQHLKENLIAQIKEALVKEKDKLVQEMVDSFNESISKALETIQRKGDDVLKSAQRKEDDVLKTIQRKGDDVLETVQSKGDYILGTVQSKGDDVLETVQSKGGDVLGTVQRKGDDVLEKIQSKGDDVLGTVKRKTDDVLETVQRKGDDILEMVQRKGDDVLETIRRQKLKN